MLFAGRIRAHYKVTSNALALTGDGVAIAYRNGVPLMDMEFSVPSDGHHRMGILITEVPAAREHFGQQRRRAVHAALRAYPARPCTQDMISRAIYQEVAETAASTERITSISI